MPSIIEICVNRDGRIARAAALTNKPITVGRAPSNEVVIPDELVSWHHALIWLESGEIRIKDLGSRNGTFVDDKRLTAPAAINEGSKIRLGPKLEIELRKVPGAGAHPSARAFVLEDLELGLQYPLRSDRFLIGTTAHADLRLESGPEEAATLILPGADEIWIGEGDEDRPLAIDESFEVNGRRFRICEANEIHAPTADPDPARYPYLLRATLDGSTGPEAQLTDTRSGLSYKVEADNRAILLFLLGRRVEDDRQDGKPRVERGWCSDDEIATGIWGRSQTARDANSLHVLVYRLRKELKKAGFDPWFIEKRKRYIRARLQEVVLD